MELTARLSEQLSLLTLGAVRDGTGLIGDLTALVATLTEAVSGYAGLRLTVVHTGHPVRITALVRERADGTVVTSLRLALPPVSSTFDEGVRLVVWSTVPGSLVDLAADLGYVFAREADGAAPSVVTLDEDLPPAGTASGVDGLDELALIQRAAGLLIARGHDPASVQETLRGDADGHGLTTYDWAVHLLRHP